MQDFLGKWKLKGINIPTENGFEFYTKDTLPEEYTENYDEANQFLLEFLEDGTFNVIAEAVGEYAQMAKDEGIEIREDGFIVVLPATWENRDGVVYYDTGAEGEIMDEEVDPFVPLEFTDDGCILYNFGMCVYERM